ncbi:hypothetical protein EJV44_12245 [Ancylobacter aquaticus]|nr:hypothetical protein EJV44_12245 [Ancylobacter aquaticus]
MQLDGRTCRTPTEHRAAIAMAGTHDIPPQKVLRAAEEPRHGHLVRDLAGLRMWFGLQSSVGDWLVADNDNTPAASRGPSEQRQLEGERDVLPNTGQMLAAVAGASPVREGSRVTLGGLRFDHGRLTGWQDGAGRWRRPAEISASRQASQAGATGSNRAVREWMATAGEWPAQPNRRRAVMPPPSGWPLRSACRDWLDVASPSTARVGTWTRPAECPASGRDWMMVAHEPVPVTRCPSPALPAIGRLPEQFLSGRCRPSGAAMPGGPDLAPQEAATIRAAEEAAADRLSRRDWRVLALSTRAATMTDIGTAAGLRGKRAERSGPDVLIAAAKNLQEILLAA